MRSLQILGSKKILVSFVILLAYVLIGMSAPYIAPYDPNEQHYQDAYKPPFFTSGDWRYLLGTDSLGRDIYSRVLYGARPALFVGVVGAFFAALIGVSLGIISGYYSVRIGEVIMRLVDIWLSLPAVVFSICLIAVLGIGLGNVAIAVIVIDWTRFARVVRSEVLNLKEREFVLAAKAIGMSGFGIIRKEILPNLLPLLTVLFTLEMSIAISVEVLLSFAGLGVKPTEPSWGSMIAEGLTYFRTSFWGACIPLIAVIIIILALNYLGDGLRERMDPRLLVIR
jgi:peptide/nickel transport system permease protein